MNASSQIVASYRDSLPAWVTEERVKAFLAEAPEGFLIDLSAAMAREKVLPGARTDVPDLIVEWLSAKELHDRRGAPATWDGVEETPIADYAASLTR